MAEPNVFGPPASLQGQSVAPSITAGPPENEQDYAQRVQGWEETLKRINQIASDPQTRAFLFTLGANLLQDRPGNTSALNQVGTSLLAAQNEAAREGERQFRQADKTRTTTNEEQRNAILRDQLSSRERVASAERRQTASLAAERERGAERRATTQSEEADRRLQLQLGRIDAQLEDSRLDRALKAKLEKKKLSLLEKKASSDLKKAGFDVRADVLKSVTEELSLLGGEVTPELIQQTYLERIRLVDPEGSKEIPASEQEKNDWAVGVRRALAAGRSPEEATSVIGTRFNDIDVQEILRRAQTPSSTPSTPGVEGETGPKAAVSPAARVSGSLSENVQRRKDEKAKAQSAEAAATKEAGGKETARRTERATVINLLNEFRGTDDLVRKEAIRSELEDIFPTLQDEGLKKRLIDIVEGL